MKIRNGFVSNSSSSSFIIRGAKLDTKYLIDTLNISNDDIEDLDEYGIYSMILNIIGSDFSIEPSGNFFGSQDYSQLIVGESIGGLDDGEVCEFKDRTVADDAKLKTLFDKWNIDIDEFKTYIQMISNDNY